MESTLDGLGDAVTALIASHDQLVAAVHERRRGPQPLSLTATATADANGNALIVYDPVPQGETWELRRLVVGGSTWATAAAGTAVSYATSGAAVATPSLLGVFDEAASLPNVAYYLDGQVVLTPGERLVVLVSGATSAQQYLSNSQLVRKEQ